MTINVDTRTRLYAPPAGQAGPFAVPFPLFDGVGRLTLLVQLRRAGSVATLISGIDYALANITDAGADLTLSAPTIAGDELLIDGNRPAERVTNLASNQPFTTPLLNAEFDQLLLMIQELRRDVERKLGASGFDPLSTRTIDVVPDTVTGFGSDGDLKQFPVEDFTGLGTGFPFSDDAVPPPDAKPGAFWRDPATDRVHQLMPVGLERIWRDTTGAKGPVVDLTGSVRLLSSYASIGVAVGAIGAAKVTLLCDVAQSVVGAVTVPANINLAALPGIALSIGTGASLVVAGPVAVPDGQQIFALSGTGTAIVTTRARLPAAWWGVLPSIADVSPAFSGMLRSLVAGAGGVVDVLPGNFNFLSNVVFPNSGGTEPAQHPIAICGAGRWSRGRGDDLPVGGTIFKFSSAAGVAHFDTRGLGELQLHNFTMQAVANTGLPFVFGSYTGLKVRLSFQGFNYGQNANNDCVWLGGTSNVQDGSIASPPFQGYMSDISECNCYRIRRLVYARVFANAIRICDNWSWISCGNSGVTTAGGYIELDGSGGAGLVKPWAAGAVAANAVVVNDIKQYTALNAGTSVTVPTHTAGTVTIDGIQWRYDKTFIDDYSVGNIINNNQVEISNYKRVLVGTRAAFNTVAHNQIYDDTGYTDAVVWWQGPGSYGNTVKAGIQPNAVLPYVRDDTGSPHLNKLESQVTGGVYKYSLPGPIRPSELLPLNGGVTIGLLGEGWPRLYLDDTIGNVPGIWFGAGAAQMVFDKTSKVMYFSGTGANAILQWTFDKPVYFASPQPVGYGFGSGGQVAQATSKSTAVTLNKANGQITLNAASLAANAVVSFQLNNSFIDANSEVTVQVKSGGTAGAYLVSARNAAIGSCQIDVRNLTGGALAEAVVLSVFVRQGSIA